MFSSRGALISLFVLAPLGACVHGPAPVSTTTAPVSALAAVQTEAPRSSAEADRPLSSVGLDGGALDRQADPCTDFYQYACGGWLAKTTIPDDRGRWSRSFSEIDKLNEERLRTLLDAAAATPGGDPVLTKVGTYYQACMNEEEIEKMDLRPIDQLLARASLARDRSGLFDAVIFYQKQGLSMLWRLNVQQGFDDATKVIASLDQGGLGLPDRDLYLESDERSRTLRDQYRNHVEAMLNHSQLMKTAEATRAASDVLEIETELARASRTRVELRDPKAQNNPRDRAQLVKALPQFPWDKYFKELGLESVTSVNVSTPRFVEVLGELAGKYTADQWRHYLQWHVLHATASVLPKRFADEDFRFRRLFSGQKQQEERWKRCVDSTDHALGELLAQPFVARYFGPTAKAATREMVGAVRTAFGQGLEGLEWMDAATREKARQKMSKMEFKVGYPDEWRRYDFPVQSTTYAANALAARQFELRREVSKVGKPVDRGEWYMSPPTVNAYYDPQKNEMVFPAGILQPPFFDERAAVAVNMGAMGMVVGHELTHGFDDEGSQFDADGNLQNWWAGGTREAFDKKTQCVVDQYSQFEALPGAKVNGKLTLGENIADLGGVKLAYSAYKQLRQGKAPVSADGFSEDQLFFLSVGQTWCTAAREESLKNLVQVDPHSPPRFRVNGTLANTPEFARAFQCKAGTPMNPASNACVVW